MHAPDPQPELATPHAAQAWRSGGFVLRPTAHAPGIPTTPAAGLCHGAMNAGKLSMPDLTLNYRSFGLMHALDPCHVRTPTDEQPAQAADAGHMPARAAGLGVSCSS